MFSAVSNRVKYRQNACFRGIVFKMFTDVIRVVLNSVRLHVLSCFQNCLCSFKLSNSVRMYHLTVNVFKIIRWAGPLPHDPLILKKLKALGVKE